MARVQDSNVKDAKGTTEVLSTAPPREVVLPTVTVVGATPGAFGEHGNFDTAVEKEHVDIAAVAPVIADATLKGRQELPESEEGKVKKERFFRVMRTATVNDHHGSGRVTMHEGKELSTKHHDVRKLQRQGLRLKEVTDLRDDEPAPTEFED